MQRRNISGNAPWESIVGYSRAVRVGAHIFVSGTTSVDAAGNVVGPGDPFVQTMHILEIIRDVLARAGAGMEDVVRTRIYTVDVGLWEQIAKAHQAFFGDVRPAATMVEVQRLIAPELLVEIEVDAVMSDPQEPSP